MSHELVEKVHRSLDAWNRGDVDGWLEAAHPEVEWISEVARRMQGAETVYRGPVEMRRFWDEWHAVWDVAIDVKETFDLGDTVVTLVRVRARGEASGIDLERPIAYAFEFEDGLARRVRSYFDPQEALDAAGLSREPIELMERLLAATAAHDRPAWERLLADTVVVHDLQPPPGWPALIEGREAVWDHLEIASEVFAGLRRENDEYLVMGDWLIVVGRWVGTARASGAPIDQRTVNAVRIEDGRVAEWVWNLSDKHAAAEHIRLSAP